MVISQNVTSSFTMKRLFGTDSAFSVPPVTVTDFPCAFQEKSDGSVSVPEIHNVPPFETFDIALSSVFKGEDCVPEALSFPESETYTSGTDARLALVAGNAVILMESTESKNRAARKKEKIFIIMDHLSKRKFSQKNY